MRETNNQIAIKTKAELLKELKAWITYYNKQDKKYYYIAQLLLGLALISSALAVLSSALEWGKTLTAILAAIPAFIYTVEARLRFEDKSFFYYGYVVKLESVRLALGYTNISVEDVIKRLDEIDKEMQYPRLGQDMKNRGQS